MKLSTDLKEKALQCKEYIIEKSNYLKLNSKRIYFDMLKKFNTHNNISNLKDKKNDSASSLNHLSEKNTNPPMKEIINDQDQLLLGNTIIFMKTLFYNELVRRSEIVSNFKYVAAEKLKCLLYSFISKKKFYKIKKSALILQQFFRDKQPMIKMKKMRALAIRIQSYWKTILTQYSFQFMRQKVIIAQSFFRRYITRKNLVNKQLAAVYLNRKFKQVLFYKRFQNRLYCKSIVKLIVDKSFKLYLIHLKNSQAIIIQSKVRQYQAFLRHYSVVMTARNKYKLIAANKAATKIQAMYKRGMAVMMYKLKKLFALQIQSFYRKFIKRRYFLILRESSLIIQNTFLTNYRRTKALRKVVKSYIEKENKPLFLNFLKDYFLLFPNSILKKKLGINQDDIVGNNYLFYENCINSFSYDNENQLDLKELKLIEKDINKVLASVDIKSKFDQLKEKYKQLNKKEELFSFDEPTENSNKQVQYITNNNASNQVTNNKPQHSLTKTTLVQQSLIQNTNTNESYNRNRYWDENIIELEKKKKLEQELLELSLHLPELRHPINPRITLFTKILSIDSLISSKESGNKNFFENYLKIDREQLDNSTPIQKIIIGDNHSCLINSQSKCFLFGFNSHGQTGLPIEENYIKNYFENGGKISYKINEGEIDDVSEYKIVSQELMYYNDKAYSKKSASKNSNGTGINKLTNQNNTNNNKENYLTKELSRNNQPIPTQNTGTKNLIGGNTENKVQINSATNYFNNKIILDSNYQEVLEKNKLAEKIIKYGNDIMDNYNLDFNLATSYKTNVFKGVNKMILTKEQTFIVFDNNNLSAFGSNNYGELGLGIKSLELAPTVNTNPNFVKNIIDISSNDNFMFALTKEGKFFGWH